jgi:hypothetical protein
MVMDNSGNHSRSYITPSVRKLDPNGVVAALERAAGDGNSEAAAMLVRIYEDGIGVDRNEPRARAWKLVVANARTGDVTPG